MIHEMPSFMLLTLAIATLVPVRTDTADTAPRRQPDARTIVVARGGDVAAPPAPLEFMPRDGVAPGTWIESDPIMLEQGGAVSVVGGEYRIYTSPWTDQPGKAGGGDALFVRVRSSDTPGGEASVQLKVGGPSAVFEVTTAK